MLGRRLEILSLLLCFGVTVTLLFCSTVLNLLVCFKLSWMVWVFLFSFWAGLDNSKMLISTVSIPPFEQVLRTLFNLLFFFGLEKFASVLFFFFLSPFCYLSNNIICTIAHMVVVKLKYGRLEVILASFIPMKPIWFARLRI